MSSRKKQKKQPFIIFCEEMQQIIPELKGKKLPQLVGHCGEIWEKMTPSEREPYVNTARDFAEHGYCPGTVAAPVLKSEADVIGKFDSGGRSLRSRQRAMVSHKYAQKLMNEDILKKTERRHSKNALLNTRFHIMTVHTWCITDDGEAHPAEIGLVELTLQEGVSSRWCQLISPIQIPYGYGAEVENRTEKIHQISRLSNQLSEDLEGIFKKIIQILTVRGREHYAGKGIAIPDFDSVPLPEEFDHAREHKLLPVYVMPKDIEEISKAFKFLTNNLKINIKFPLYELPMLMMHLINYSFGSDTKPLTEAIAEMELSKDVALYTQGISCNYHEKTESHNCAGAKATRMAIILCDFCCQAYMIEAKSGRHTLADINEGNISNLANTSNLANISSFANNSSMASIVESLSGIVESSLKLSRDGDVVDSGHPFQSYLSRGGRLNGDESDIRSLVFDPQRSPATENPSKHNSFKLRAEIYANSIEPAVLLKPPTTDGRPASTASLLEKTGYSSVNSTFRTANSASGSSQAEHTARSTLT